MADENLEGTNDNTPESSDGGSPETFDFRSLVGEDGGFVEKWTEQLPEDLRAELGDSKAFANIKHPKDLIKTTISNSRLAGRALLPGKDAKPEDWQKVLDTMPKPGEGEGYGLSDEQITDESLKRFNEKTGYLEKLERVLRRAGVPSVIAARIAEADAVEKSEMLRELNEDAAKAKAAVTERLGGERQYEAARLDGRDALARLYGDSGKDAFEDVVQRLEAYGLADHPAFVDMFHRIATRMGPGKIVAGGAGGGGGSPTSIHGTVLSKSAKAIGAT